MNKKAQTTTTRKLILGAVMLVICVALIYLFIVKPVFYSDIQKTCQLSNSLQNVKGYCKEKCAVGEMKLKGYGCEDNDDGAPIYCCINLDYESEDYGGDADYRFDIFDIGLDSSQITSGKCEESGSWTYECTSGRDIKVKMTVTNTGNFEIPIFANPKVGETYPPPGTPTNFKPGETKILTVNINLEAKKSYIIKAAAKCNTGICKTTFGDDGIFKLNDDQHITVIIS